VSFNPAGVSSVDLADDDIEERFASRFGRRMVPARPPRGWDVKIDRAIERGAPGDLPIDFRTTEFRRAVLEAAATIPRGQVRSYGWLARRVGNEGATRAVGSTMASNPVPLIVPCHRVVRTDGRIGNYSLGGTPQQAAAAGARGRRPGVAGVAGQSWCALRRLGHDSHRLSSHVQPRPSDLGGTSRRVP
jgi:O-6-methylguanine DNA methyltransferase